MLLPWIDHPLGKPAYDQKKHQYPDNNGYHNVNINPDIHSDTVNLYSNDHPITYQHFYCYDYPNTLHDPYPDDNIHLYRGAPTNRNSNPLSNKYAGTSNANHNPGTSHGYSNRNYRNPNQY